MLKVETATDTSEVEGQRVLVKGVDLLTMKKDRKL